MKTTIAKILCVCYAALLLHPAIPVLQDVMAHVLWENEHIATVHYENGAYHLHVEIKKASDNTEPASGHSKNTTQEPNVHYAAAENEIQNPILIAVRLVEYTRHSVLRDGYFSVPAPPPWLV